MGVGITGTAGVRLGTEEVRIRGQEEVCVVGESDKA